MDSGLCQNDGQAQKEGETDKQPRIALRKTYAEFIADRHEPNGNRRLENNQSEEGIKDTYDNGDDTLFGYL